MLIKQIDVNEAMELHKNGMEVKMLVPGAEPPEGGWEDYMPTTLQDMLNGCLFFRDVPAVVNPEFEEALPPVVPPPSIPQYLIGPQWTVVPNVKR